MAERSQAFLALLGMQNFYIERAAAEAPMPTLVFGCYVQTVRDVPLARL